MSNIGISVIGTYDGPTPEQEVAELMAALNEPLDESAERVKAHTIENWENWSPYPRVDTHATINSGRVDPGPGGEFIVSRDITFGENAEKAEFGQQPGEGPLVTRTGRDGSMGRWAEQSLQDWVDRHFSGNPRELDRIGYYIGLKIQEIGVPPTYGATNAADAEIDPLSDGILAALVKVYA